MALQAKGHAEGLCLPHLIHFVNVAMTMHATDAAVNVHGVIEVNEIRHFVDLHPGNGFARLRTFSHQRQAWIVLEHLIVAIHARRTGGNV